MERGAFALLVVLVAGLAFVVLPQAFESYIRPKETFLRLGVLAILLLAVLGALFQGSVLRLPLVPVNLFAGLFVLWSWVTVLWADAPQLALQDAARWTVFLLLFFLVQSFLAGSRRRLLVVFGALGLSSLVVALLVILQDFRQAFLPGTLVLREVLGDWRDALSRVAFGNTSHIADYLALGFLYWLAVFFVMPRRRWRWAATVALWLHAAALIVCWSVHSNLSLIVAAAFLGFLLRHELADRLPRFPRRYVGWLVAGWVLVTAFYTLDHPANPHGSHVWGQRTHALAATSGEGGSGGIFAEAFASPRWHAGWDTRLAIWLTTLEIVRNNTWIGAGAGNFTYVYPETFSPAVEASPSLAPYAGRWTNAAHNDILQRWAETGIVGLMLFVLMVAVSIKASVERLRGRLSRGNRLVLAAALCALVAQLVQMQMNFPLDLPVSTMLFFVLLAVPFVLPKLPPEQRDLLVPVERPFGPLRLGIMMENMARPSEVHLGWRAGGLPGWIAGAAVLAGALLLAEHTTRPLRADIVFRTARDAKLMADAGRHPGGYDDVLAQFERALAIWPWHRDTLSNYQDALMRAGRYEEAIRATEQVLGVLNATEVHERRAVALMGLGRFEESLDDWEKIYRREPEKLRGRWDVLEALEERLQESE